MIYTMLNFVSSATIPDAMPALLLSRYGRGKRYLTRGGWIKVMGERPQEKMKRLASEGIESHEIECVARSRNVLLT
jgi:hypothetical protein